MLQRLKRPNSSSEDSSDEEDEDEDDRDSEDDLQPFRELATEAHNLVKQIKRDAKEARIEQERLSKELLEKSIKLDKMLSKHVSSESEEEEEEPSSVTVTATVTGT